MPTGRRSPRREPSSRPRGSRPRPKRASLGTTDGYVAVQDGPYPDTREQLGGYFIIDVTDGDEARRWAARCPGVTWGIVELRPIMDRTGGN